MELSTGTSTSRYLFSMCCVNIVFCVDTEKLQSGRNSDDAISKHGCCWDPVGNFENQLGLSHVIELNIILYGSVVHKKESNPQLRKVQNRVFKQNFGGPKSDCVCDALVAPRAAWACRRVVVLHLAME